MYTTIGLFGGRQNFVTGGIMVQHAPVFGQPTFGGYRGYTHQVALQAFPPSPYAHPQVIPQHRPFPNIVSARPAQRVETPMKPVETTGKTTESRPSSPSASSDASTESAPGQQIGIGGLSTVYVDSADPKFVLKVPKRAYGNPDRTNLAVTSAQRERDAKNVLGDGQKRLLLPEADNNQNWLRYRRVGSDIEYFFGVPGSQPIGTQRRYSSDEHGAAAHVLRRMLESHKIVSDAGGVHRDFKLANMMIDGDDLVLGDFGFFTTNLSKFDHLYGSSAHVAPEMSREHSKSGIHPSQVVTQPTKEMDLFSIGMSIYDLYGLTAAIPKDRLTPHPVEMRQMEASLDAIVRGNPDGEAVAQIARTLTQFNPSGRSSSQALLSMLNRSTSEDGNKACFNRTAASQTFSDAKELKAGRLPTAMAQKQVPVQQIASPGFPGGAPIFASSRHRQRAHHIASPAIYGGRWA